MELKDLFVNFKQVDPVSDSFEAPSLPTSLYFNYDRASKAASGESSSNPVQSQDMSTWKVGGGDQGIITPWRVETAPKQTNVQPKEPVSNASQKSSRVVSKWNNPYTNNRQLWKQDMTNAYKKAGLSDNAIKNLIAKNALESGWGKSAQGSYNFGNITTGSKWTGKYIDGRDKDAEGNPITNRFRAYDSLEDYVTDEIQFLTRLYDFNGNDDFETFIGKLQGNNSGKRRYAEDKTYAAKVRGVYNSI